MFEKALEIALSVETAEKMSSRFKQTPSTTVTYHRQSANQPQQRGELEMGT